VDRLKTAKKLIEAKWDRKSPLLLGYSGGPDSKALLYYLLESGVATLHLAHVDHGWREESRSEALQLQAEAERVKLPFHLIRLESLPKANLEEHGRNERLAFFQSLFKKIPFQALLLAHQSDDRAETSLKRLFEGAQLASLTGLAPVSQMKGMEVWRPLLAVSKQEIWDYLDRKQLTPLLDPSNENPRFLRTRLRTQILPTLSAQFGKEIRDNLCCLSERSQELKDYLDERTQSAWERRVEEERGVRLDLTELERIEVRHLLQRVVSFSRQMLEDILDDLASGQGNKSYSMNGKTLVVEGRCIVTSAGFSKT
jgi:tRNA(Ile)-lysidine synthase